jgi:serine/threonine protein phosphatase PrpC
MANQPVQSRKTESFLIQVSLLDYLHVAVGTDVGRVRRHQEDAVGWRVATDPRVLAHKGAIFVLADGMGGHAAGEIASQMAVDRIVTAYYQDPVIGITDSLRHALDRASQSIYVENRRANLGGRARMGTTTTAVVLRGHELYVAHVGDSRAYLIRDRHIQQLTEDHSWVQEQVRRGILSPREARAHPRRHVITRSLGQRAQANADYYPVRHIERGDVVLLCSDGLTAYLSDKEICQVVSQVHPEKSVVYLLDAANQRGGNDNASLMVMKLEGPSLACVRTQIESWFRGGNS